MKKSQWLATGKDWKTYAHHPPNPKSDGFSEKGFSELSKSWTKSSPVFASESEECFT